MTSLAGMRKEWQGHTSMRMDEGCLDLKPGKDVFSCTCGVAFPVVLPEDDQLTRTVEYLSKFPVLKREISIGCRRIVPRVGSVGIDFVPPIWEKKHPERFCRADGRCLPYVDGFFGSVRATHVFEHIGRHNREREFALKEWWRVLAPGGELYITVPNMIRFCRQYLSGKWSMEEFNMVTFGLQNRPGEFHFYGYDPKGLVREVLRILGKKGVQVKFIGVGHRGRYRIPDFEVRGRFVKK